MNLIKQLLKPFSSFRGRILGIVSLGIISLALTASVTAALVTGYRAADQMVAQGLKIVETLAEQSVLSLLYESGANAEKPLEAIMSFPDVERAGVFYRNLTPLLTTGTQPYYLPEQLATDSLQQSSLVKETNQAWHFVAPVQIKQQDELFPDDSFLPQTATTTEILGYAYVVMDKSTLRDLQLNVTLNNIFIALSFAVLLTLLVNFGIDRMMQPLYKLIRVMEKNEKEHTRVYADLSGTNEITHIANVFNRMMSSLDERDRRLREHGEKLESIVEIRTQELVTARDAALAASRQKSEFLANMSHELRTPLQAIIGYSDVVKEELELDGMNDHVEGLNRVIRNSNRLLALINNILDMAKIESGKMALKVEQVNFQSVIKEASDTIIPILKHNNNHFESEHKSTTETLTIDREKLLQMILNLLSNAGKFTKNGTVRFSSQLSPDMLNIEVSDTGIGLSAEEQKIIFEEFRQVDGSTTRDFEGTGLGLTITKRFAEQMGGRINVVSKPGKGSTFNIHIPLPVTMEHQTPNIINQESDHDNRCVTAENSAPKTNDRGFIEQVSETSF